MVKNEKNKPALILILVLVGVIDLILFALYLNGNTAISFSDIGIWVGSLGSIAAFTAVIITTQMQIKAQKKNLQEQIDNQNKQMHRPFLWIDNVEILYTDTSQHKRWEKDIEEATNGKDIAHLSSNNLSHGSSNEQFKSFRISFINNGKGIATNIVVYDLITKKYVWAYLPKKDSKQEKKIHRSEAELCISVKKGLELEKLELTMKYDLVGDGKSHGDERDGSVALVLYTDILGNIYKLLIAIKCKKNMKKPDEIDWSYGIINQESNAMKDTYERYKVNVEEIIANYKERVLNRGEWSN